MEITLDHDHDHDHQISESPSRRITLSNHRITRLGELARLNAAHARAQPPRAESTTRTRAENVFTECASLDCTAPLFGGVGLGLKAEDPIFNVHGLFCRQYCHLIPFSPQDISRSTHSSHPQLLNHPHYCHHHHHPEIPLSSKVQLVTQGSRSGCDRDDRHPPMPCRSSFQGMEKRAVSV